MRVGDFGLAEDIYTTGYFRQGKDDAVKLPFKWMAPESLRDGLFSEKSDVVSLVSYTVVRKSVVKVLMITITLKYNIVLYQIPSSIILRMIYHYTKVTVVLCVCDLRAVGR